MPRPLALLVLGLALAPTPADADDFVDALEALRTSAGIPGLAVATIEDGTVDRVVSLGVSNLETGRPVGDTTVFEAASLSKTLTAYVALRLADRGRLDLDAPLFDHLQYERLADDPLAPTITARMVLSHTSGLPNWGGTPLERNFDPGTDWGYSGEGYVFLSRVIEAVEDDSFENVVRREVFEPLGLEHSAFVWRADFESIAANGHDTIGRPIDLRRRDDENAAASLYTTARDYATFVASVLQGRGLSEDAHAAMFAPVGQVTGWGDEEAASRLQWGLGWGLQAGDPVATIWHWGDNGQFRCFVWADPATRDGVVVFTNSQLGHTILVDLLALVCDDAMWSVAWLGPNAHDDPVHRARIAARRAFAFEGFDAGWERIRAYETSTGVPVAEGELLDLADFLDDDHAATAIALLAHLERERPSAAVVRALGEARTVAGAHQQALDDLRRAIELDPALEEQLAGRIAWLATGLERGPTHATAEELRAVAGQYGPRILVFEDGVLFYSREGATQRTRLIPLGVDRFGLEGNHGFRILVERNASGQPVAIVGEYADGRTDRTAQAES